MYFLSWIIVGLVAGWSAGKILKGNGYGPLMDIAIGIGGAVAGGSRKTRLCRRTCRSKVKPSCLGGESSRISIALR